MDASSGAEGPPKKNQFKCIVPGCRSSTSTNLAKLHSFPWRDMPRARKWIVAVGCLELLDAPPKALLRLRVCDLHFDKKLKRGKNMKLWDNSAVPTLKLSSVKKSEIGKKLRKKRMKKKTIEVVDSNVTPQPIAEMPTNDTNGATPTPIRLPRELARFLSLREKMQKKNTARKGYDKRFSVFALKLRLSCPEAYRVLWKSLRLPPPALLLRVDLGVGTHFDSELMRCFEAKMERIDPRERECTLCLDEVELTKKLFYVIDKDEIVGLEEIEGVLRVAPAARALVVAARGLRGGWTQPLGYFLLAEDADMRELVAPLRRLIVHALYGRARCPVRAVVAALGPTFAELAHALGVSAESPFVLDAAPRRRVCFLHDPEQLLLTLRDTLMAYDILFRDPVGGAELRASWTHVERLHAADSARALRLLPELTRACVRPDARQALRERHAAALFSRRVAAHMAAGSAGADLKCAGTARLLLLAADVRRELRAPRPSGLARLAAAAHALGAALRDMRIVSPDGAEHDAEVFVRALQVSLAGALHLLAEGGEGEREAPLRLARCGLRPLRRFIERAEGPRGRAEPRELRRRFRRWAMRRLLAPGRAGGARADGLAALLRAAEEQEAREAAARPARGVATGPLRHRVDVRRGCSWARAAAALLAEARRAHGCARFVRWAREASRAARLLREMEATFRRQTAGRAPNALGARALAALGAAPAARWPCACFPRDTFCRLFVRFRIRAALQAYNGSLRGLSGPGVTRWLF